MNGEEQQEKEQPKLRLRLKTGGNSSVDNETAGVEADQTARAAEPGVTDPLSLRETNLDKLKRISATNETTDPLSLRDTNLDKLRRINPNDQPSDPLKLRDTDLEKLKVIRPPGKEEDDSGAPQGATDTVRLKVVREKKKELSRVLTASQTIHLRPPAPAVPEGVAGGGSDEDEAAGVPLAKAEKRPGAVSLPGKTLKITPTSDTTGSIKKIETGTRPASLRIEKPPLAVQQDDPAKTGKVPTGLGPTEEHKAVTATAPLQVRPRKPEAGAESGATVKVVKLGEPKPPTVASIPENADEQTAQAASDGEQTQKTVAALPQPGKPVVMPPPQSEADTEEKPQAKPLTVKIKAPSKPLMPPLQQTDAKAEAARTVEVKLPPVSNEPEVSKAPVNPPPAVKSKMTLKLKGPETGAATGKTIVLSGTPGGDDAGATKAGEAEPAATAKLESPDGEKTVAVSQDDETQEQEESKGGLKLRKHKAVSDLPPSMRPESDEADAAVAAMVGADVGVFACATTAVTTLALAVLTALVVMQYFAFCK